MTRLGNLKDIKPLAEQTDKMGITALQFVKSYKDSVAYTEGAITSLSWVYKEGDISLPTLELGTEATALQYLCLRGHKSLTEVVFETALPSLTHLYLDNCGLTEIRIPAGCKALKQIYLQGNGLTKIIFEGDCSALELLDLSKNQLTEFSLPKGFRQLKYLYLNDNKIQILSFVSNLRRLTILHLNNNELIKLPDNFLAFTQLETLYLHNNPLENPPKSLIASEERENSLDAIRSYLKEYSKGTIINERAKLIIVGNGRVGKTSMYRLLKNDDFDKNEKYTHGIHIGDLEKAHIPEAKTDKVQLKVWDFGGQEIFFATHQFFLSEEAVYILAWTNEKNVLTHRERDKETLPFDEKWRDCGYWLNNIRLHGKDSPILMVQTNSDCRAHILTPESYCTEAPYKADLLNFSALNKRGLDELKEFIADKLNQVILSFGKEFPETYDAVIDAVEELTEKSISLKAFYKICKDAKISKGNELAVLDYLKKAGLVVYFDKPLLKEVVFTDPNWLTQEVYHLINNDLRNKKGKINEAYLAEILRGYSPMQRNQFVELLKNFELIFETGDENKRLYIAPQYLPDSLEDEAQELYEMVFEDLSLAFVFRFPKFMPDNIMINFLSRYGPFSKRMYWKKGICFTSDKKVKCSVVYDEKDQSLSVYTSKSAESLDLHYEICQAFVELSKNTHAEISVDGHAFASWQELKKHAELYEKDPNHQFFAVDGVTHLCMKDFAVFVGKGDMRRYLGGEKTSEEPIKNKEKMELNSLKQQVKSYIGVAKPEKAIEVIETWAFNQGDNDAQTAITMIKADWNNLQRERNIGILDNGEVRQRNAIINNRLLEFMWTTDTTLNPRVDVHINPPTPSPTPDLDGENTPPNPTKKKAISFLTADPKTLNQIGASVQKQKIEDIVKGIFEFDDYMNTKYNEIGKYIVDKEIVHITVHGKTGELFFIHATAEGEDNAVTSAYLCRQFKNVNQVKELVMLIACNSETTAQALFEQGLAKYVVGTTMPISVKAAIDFSAQFYTLLKDDFDIPKVFDNTCFELNQDKLRPKYDTDEGGLYDYYKVFKLFH